MAKSIPNLMETSEYHAMYQVETELWWYRSLRLVLRNILRKYVPHESTILDAGCGTGINSLLFESLGYQVNSIDLSTQAVDYCHQRGLHQATVGDITNLPARPNQYQAVCCLDVLIMLTATENNKAIQEMYRVLKPGGIAIVQVAALEWLRSPHDSVSHVRKRYTRRELASLFPSNQWHVLCNTYRIWLLFPFIALVKLFKKLRFKNAEPQGDLWIPPYLINQSLFSAQWLEDQLLPRFSLPWGTSVFIVVQKKV